MPSDLKGLGYEPKRTWPEPSIAMCSTPEFEKVWNAIRDWDIHVPGAYTGYCGSTGNHVRAILDALLDSTPEPSLVLEPLHIKLLKRGVGGGWILLSDNMGLHMAEVCALGDLKRAGFVEDAPGPFPPGPKGLPPRVITKAGRDALANLTD